MNSTQLLQGDFRDLCNTLAPESIDAIVTDPPYGKEALPLYEALAKTGARVLKDGGHLFVMTGSYHLPEIMARISKHLTYHWTIALVMRHHVNAVSYPRKVIIMWKPILWFTKGKAKFHTGAMAFDIIHDSGANKAYHRWGQSSASFLHLIEYYTNLGDTVLDPMVGGGEVGVAALQSGRNFIGMDIDPAAIATTTKRLRAIKNRTCIPYLEMTK